MTEIYHWFIYKDFIHSSFDVEMNFRCSYFTFTESTECFTMYKTRDRWNYCKERFYLCNLKRLGVEDTSMFYDTTKENHPKGTGGIIDRSVNDSVIR